MLINYLFFFQIFFLFLILIIIMIFLIFVDEMKIIINFYVKFYLS